MLSHMEKKIFLQELADAIAEKEGISKKNAENFTKIFFDIIEEGLAEDKFVKIKGFGTFKIVLVGERESVNINTGERIQIGGHNKITFTPDTLLKDLVNKPFAHFQTITLNDETDIDELESVVTEEEPVAEIPDQLPEISENLSTPHQDESETKAVNTTSAPIHASATEELLQKTDEEEENKTKETDEEPENHDSITSSSLPELPVEETSDSTSVEEPEGSDKRQTAETEESHVTDAQKEETPEVPATTEQTSESIEPEQGADDPSAPPVEDPTENQDKTTATAQEATDELPIHSNRKRWRTIMFIAFTLLLMVLSYFAGYFRVLCPNCPHSDTTAIRPEKSAQPRASITKQSKVDSASLTHTSHMPGVPADSISDNTTDSTISNGNIEPAAMKAEKKALQQADAQEKSINEERTYTVKRGDNIYSIAKKMYGNKDYARQIIRHNHLKDPDNIAIGSTLKLPAIKSKE